MATSLKELIVTFEANAKPVINALNQIDSKLKHTTRSLQSTGEAFVRAGKEIGLALSLPIAGLGASSIKAIADIQSLEASLTSVLKKYNTGLPIQQAVTAEIDHMKSVSKELGTSFTESVKPYVKYLAASKDSLETNRKVIKSFLGLSAGLGLTADDTKRVIRSLEQMQSKGQIMSEELKLQLGDAIPGAVALFADSLNLSTNAFLDLIEKGEVSSKILSRVADTINKKYGESIKKGSLTIRANLNRIGNAFYDLRINIGRSLDEVYNINNSFRSFANWLDRVAQNFKRLDDKGKKIILTIGLLVAGLGPLLIAIGVLSKLIGIAILGFRVLTKPLFLIIGLLPKMIAGFRALALVMAANPLGAFVTASSLIVVYWKEIVGLFQKASDWLTKISLSGVWSKFKDFVGFGDDQVDISSGAKASMANTTNMSSIANNQKTVNNNLTVNIPPGMSGSDATGIKDAIKQALQEENRQSYIELGAQ